MRRHVFKYYSTGTNNRVITDINSAYHNAVGVKCNSIPNHRTFPILFANGYQMIDADARGEGSGLFDSVAEFFPVPA